MKDKVVSVVNFINREIPLFIDRKRAVVGYVSGEIILGVGEKRFVNKPRSQSHSSIGSFYRDREAKQGFSGKGQNFSVQGILIGERAACKVTGKNHAKGAGIGTINFPVREGNQKSDQLFLIPNADAVTGVDTV